MPCSYFMSPQISGDILPIQIKKLAWKYVKEVFLGLSASGSHYSSTFDIQIAAGAFRKHNLNEQLWVIRKGRAWLCGCCPELGWGELACPSLSFLSECCQRGPWPRPLQWLWEMYHLRSPCDRENHISSIRLISDQAGERFCLQCVSSSLCSSVQV